MSVWSSPRARPLATHEDVGRLQVAVEDTAPVGMVDGTGERFDQPGRRPRLLWRTRELPVETAAVHVFEHQVIHAVLVADFMDLHDVGMLQAGHRFGLGAEAGHLLVTSR